MSSRSWLHAAWAALFCLCLSAHGATTDPLKVGILPTLSTRTLLGNYQPLRDFLERELQRPVVLLTAPDFRAFHRDTEAGVFDLAVTAPHLARLAQLEGRMQVLAAYRADNRALVIMARARPVKSIGELRGRTLAIFDPLALVVLQALDWFAQQGLQPGRDFRVLDTPSHTSVAYSVMGGESLLGVTAPAGMRQWPEGMRGELQVLTELPAVPALVWTAHPRLGAESERVKAALLRLPDSAEGRQFLANTGYQGIREATPGELRALDPYAREVARLLRSTP